VEVDGAEEVSFDCHVGRTGVLAHDIHKSYGVHAKGTRVRVAAASTTHRGLYEVVGIDANGNVIYDDTQSAREYIQGVSLDWITFDA
jgi:hypothetical protein